MPIPPHAPIFKFADGPGIDAFGRLRTSSQITVFDGQQVYSNHPLQWDHHTSGTGSATHSTQRSSTTLSTGGTAVGARALRQSKVYHRYIPGTSLIVKMTGVMLSAGTHSGGSKTMMMYGDDSNGIGVQHTAAGFAIVKRTNTTGSVVDSVIASADWNIDKMNNMPMQSPSMITLDATKSQIFVLDLQWLGVGRIRCGFQINGQFYPVHEFTHANTTTGVYMQSASLPVRWEAVNDSTGANVSIESICCSVEVESAQEVEAGYSWSASNGVTAINTNASTYVPVVSLRLKSLLNGIPSRSHIHLQKIMALVGTSALHYKLILNPTLGSGTSWTDVNSTYSGVEFDVGSTTVSGGVEIESGYLNTGLNDLKIASTSEKIKLLLGKKYDGTADILTLAVRTTGGTGNILSALSFIEQY